VGALLELAGQQRATQQQAKGDRQQGGRQRNDDDYESRGGRRRRRGRDRFRDRAFDIYFSDPRYLELVRRRFGVETEREIREMTGRKLERKYA